MHGSEIEITAFQGNLRSTIPSPERQARRSRLREFQLSDICPIAIELPVRLRVEEGIGCEMSCGCGQVHDGRANISFVDAARVSVVWIVALRCFQVAKEWRLQFGVEEVPCQLQYSACITQHLHGLYTSDVIEEPAAAGVHQHGVTLQLEKPQRARRFPGAQPAESVALQERRLLRAPVQHNVDVISARRPRIAQQVGRRLPVSAVDLLAKTVDGRPQRAAPGLRPAWVLSRVAAAITTPALNSMRATPGAVR